jgi:hypothetical protein
LTLNLRDLEEIVSRLSEKDDDPRMTLGYITQAWTDIRAYTTNIWQVAAVGLTVVILVLNVVVSSTTSEGALPSWLIWGLGAFALVFLSLTSYSIAWFRRSIADRVKFISTVEERLIEIKGTRLVVSGEDLFSVSQGPLKFLLFIFYLLVLVVGSFVVFDGTMQAIPVLSPVTIDPSMIFDMSLVLSLYFGAVAMALFQIGYGEVRATEAQATIQAEKVVSVQKRIFESGIEFERKVCEKLQSFANKYGHKVVTQKAISSRFGTRRYRVDAALNVDSQGKLVIPFEAKLRFSKHALDQVRDYMLSLNSKLGVIVTQGEGINEEWIGTSEIRSEFGSVGVIGLDADFEVIQTWIQKIQKE